MDPLEALSMDAAQATAAACMGCVGGTQCENLSATGVSWAAADDANPIAIAAITPRESIFISHPPKIVLRTSMVPLQSRRGSLRQDRPEITERAGTTGSSQMTPNAASHSAPARENLRYLRPYAGRHSARCTGSRICEGCAAE
jgi:hypothetical protein